MIVSKFGGSIIADTGKLARAMDILKSNPERRYIIASAPGQNPNAAGITNLLFMCHSSFSKRENYNILLAKISEIYNNIINSLGVKFDLDSEIDELRKNLISGKSGDYIGSRGEYITGRILAKFLGWEFVDASELIFFHEDGTLDKGKTFTTARNRLQSLEHAVIPSFYGIMPDGNIKTFQRGDGDSSGAIVASAVNADLFEKWSSDIKTYSADPAIVPNPETIKNITYDEAVELNYSGINIIKDSVIFMLKESGIPLKICCIEDEDDGNNGMLISSQLPGNISRNIAVCITGRRNFDVIHLEKYGLNQEYGFGAKLFGLFTNYHIPCEHCLSGIYKMSFVIKNMMFNLHYKEIIDDIKREMEPDSITVEKNLSLIAVIGQEMGTVKGMFEKVFSALANAQIKVKMIDQGSDDLNIILGVSDSDYENAIKALYQNLIVKGD
ncbi:MAG: hypothetical protein IJS99_08060 [Synergistaceae bacterium]|nr:hypothetical protein [Synergistaceae bacterium]